MTVVENLREKLFEFEDKDYAKFSKKLCPDTKKEILGVRIPVLRKFAKDFSRNEDCIKFLDEALKIKEGKYVEEVIFQGMIIGYSKLDLSSKMTYLKSFVPKIDSWVITDTVIPTLKFKDKDLKEIWKFILPYTESKEEFEVRFAVIMMLDYFINDEYVDEVIKVIDNIKTDKYYAQMAMAWTLAEIGIKYQEKLLKYMKNKNNLDKFTFNKTLQKMIESFRVDDELKNLLRGMKRK